MEQSKAKKSHFELQHAGFRSRATAAGFLQLTRELKALAVIDDQAIERIREAMLSELLENLPRSLVGDSAYEDRLRERLKALLAGDQQSGS